MTATKFTGQRIDHWVNSVQVVDGRGERPLPLRLDLYSHLPNGVQWGYSGSGP